MLRIGFIGAGDIAAVHVEAVRNFPDATITAVSDPVQEKAEALAAPIGAAAYTDHRDVIDRCDAVWVCTPPSVRRVPIVDAAEAGRHVMAEKPLATAADDALAIVEAVERSGVKCIVDFMSRFRWPFLQMKKLVDTGDLGAIVSIWSYRLGQAGYPSGQRTWRHDRQFACGFTIESLSHDIDLIRWIAGPITAVSGLVAATWPDFPTFDNTMGAILYLESGAMGQLHASLVSPVGASQRGVIGTRGTALIEGKGIWDLPRMRWRTEGAESEQVIDLPGPLADDMGYRSMARYFLDCIREDQRPRPTARDGLAALEVSLAILRAAAERQVVSVPVRSLGE